MRRPARARHSRCAATRATTTTAASSRARCARCSARSTCAPTRCTGAPTRLPRRWPRRRRGFCRPGRARRRPCTPRLITLGPTAPSAVPCRPHRRRRRPGNRVSVSYLEIYNEGLYDLLADARGGSGELSIVDDAVAGGASNVRRAEQRRAAKQGLQCCRPRAFPLTQRRPRPVSCPGARPDAGGGVQRGGGARTVLHGRGGAQHGAARAQRREQPQPRAVQRRAGDAHERGRGGARRGARTAPPACWAGRLLLLGGGKGRLTALRPLQTLPCRENAQSAHPAPPLPTPRRQLSKLTLVDLAGSERTKKTNAAGDAMREAAAINKSLSFLEQVVNALARGDAHVPFRCAPARAAGLRHGRGGLGQRLGRR
jgi:hypothetical protein